MCVYRYAHLYMHIHIEARGQHEVSWPARPGSLSQPCLILSMGAETLDSGSYAVSRHCGHCAISPTFTM